MHLSGGKSWRRPLFWPCKRVGAWGLIAVFPKGRMAQKAPWFMWPKMLWQKTADLRRRRPTSSSGPTCRNPFLLLVDTLCTFRLNGTTTKVFRESENYCQTSSNFFCQPINIRFDSRQLGSPCKIWNQRKLRLRCSSEPQKLTKGLDFAPGKKRKGALQKDKWSPDGTQGAFAAWFLAWFLLLHVVAVFHFRCDQNFWPVGSNAQILTSQIHFHPAWRCQLCDIGFPSLAIYWRFPVRPRHLLRLPKARDSFHNRRNQFPSKLIGVTCHKLMLHVWTVQNEPELYLHLMQEPARNTPITQQNRFGFGRILFCERKHCQQTFWTNSCSAFGLAKCRSTTK